MSVYTERKPDKLILIVTLILVCLGVLMVYSTTAVSPPVEDGDGSTIRFTYLKKHLFTIMIGIFVMSVCYRLPLEGLGSFSPLLLVFAAVLLLMVFSPFGHSAGGARRWIRLWPSTFQPSELVKLSMVVFLAWYVSRQGFKVDRFRDFAVPVAIMGGFQVVFLLQPDFGAAMSLGALTVGMLFLSGTRLRYLAGLAAAALPAAGFLIMRESYRVERIVSFLDPWKDPRGSGFQLIQSYIAFGSGGYAGLGLGQSRQKLRFLPEVHTDFIFSVVGEELGFIRAALVVALFAALFIRGVMIASRARSNFHYHLAFGLSLMIAFQAMVNFCVVTGLLPTKGLPLPFISYGGSSLLVNVAAVGMLLNISAGIREKARRKAEGAHDEVLRRKKARRAVYGATEV